MDSQRQNEQLLLALRHLLGFVYLARFISLAH